MTADRPLPTDAELHAFLDGELDEARRAAVEAHLATDPQAAARIAAWAEVGAALHAAYDGVLDEPLPDDLLPARPGRRWAAPALAAGIALAVGLTGGFFGARLLDGSAGGGAALADRAIEAHRTYSVEVRHPVEVAGSEEAHLEQWLSRRLGRAVQAPALEAEGFSLVGGRLLPAGEAPAGLLMYEDRTGMRVTLTMVPTSAEGESAFRYTDKDGLCTFFWRDRGLAYALVGPDDRERMRRLADRVYEELETAGAPRRS